MTERQCIFAKGLFVASIIYGLLAIIVGYLYSLPKSWFFGMLAITVLIMGCYHYRAGRYLDTNVGLYGVIVIIYAIVTSIYGISQRQPLVTDKSELVQITGTIPERSFEVKKGKHYDYYFRFNEINLSCKETDSNSCQKVYEYKGQTATTLYQKESTNGNLLYELQIGNHKIYDFDSQLQFYKNERQKVNLDLYLLILFYGLPMAVFAWLIHQNSKKYHHNDNQSNESDEELIEKPNKEISLTLLFCGLISAFLVILGFILLLWGKNTQNHALALQGLAMIIIFGYVVYLAV